MIKAASGVPVFPQLSGRRDGRIGGMGTEGPTRQVSAFIVGYDSGVFGELRRKEEKEVKLCEVWETRTVGEEEGGKGR